MTIDNDDDLKALSRIGRIVFETMTLMQTSMRIGMSTLELDKIGADHLAKYGARLPPY